MDAVALMDPLILQSSSGKNNLLQSSSGENHHQKLRLTLNRRSWALINGFISRGADSHEVRMISGRRPIQHEVLMT